MAVFGFLRKKETQRIDLPPMTGEQKAEGRHVSYLEMPPLPLKTTTTQSTPIKLPEFPKMPAREDSPSAIPPLEFPRTIVPKTMEPKRAPIFVGMQQYNAVLSELDVLKSQISAAENNLQMLLDNKSREDSELEKWRSSLEDIERRLLFVDRTLFEH